MESSRLFLGIPVGCTLQAELHRIAALVHSKWPGLGLVSQENYHLTLKFLGDVDNNNLDQVIEALRPLQQFGPGILKLSRCGAFPTGGAARVIWCGCLDPDGKISAIAAAADSALAPLGFDNEPREFHAHITIARSRGIKDSKPLRQLLASIASGTAEERIDKVILYRSILEPSGSRYETLAQFPLSGEMK